MLPEQQLNTALEGRYKVEREIGSGGMATVYLALDVRHSRKVALKVLKPELGAVLGVQRFLAEIQVTANLQHPNLLPLFDSGEANGLLFYVMPFVEGETLRHRLDREKQLPIDEAVRIASAIAGALDHAHQRGVIHRDLKPENILLQSGQPMIADFGIALAVSNAGGARITQTGLSLGTPQYMSPEQATGDRAIDGRTDIYSLGAMTFEMLVGDPPHVGSTAQAIIAKVLTERPPSVRVVRPTVSDELAWAVEHALEKLPADRWSTAREFADALQSKTSAARSRGGGAALRAPQRSSAQMRALLGATSGVALLAVAAAVYVATRPSPAEVTGRFEIGLPDSVAVSLGAGTKLALSPDGTQLVIVASRGNGLRGLYVRRLDDPVARLIRGSDSAYSPTFSADGRWLLFRTTSTLKKLPVTGGTAQTLADSVTSAGSWGDGGRLVFDQGNSLWVGTSEGGDAKQLVGPDTSRRMYRYRWPEVLPGATHALVTIDGSPTGGVVDSLRLGVVSVNDGTVTDLGVAGTNAHYAAPGRIVFGRPGGLVFSAPFSLRSRRVTGPAELLVQNVWQGFGGAAAFAVSRTAGVLALYAGVSGERRLVIVDRTGAERALRGDQGKFNFPRVSPDGRRVAVEIGDPNASSVWIVDMVAGARSRLVPDSTSIRPEWTRDGSRVVFERRVRSAGLSRPWDQNGSQEVLWTKPAFEVAVGPKGGYWAFHTGTASLGNNDIAISPADSLDAMVPFVATPASESQPRVSPNGRLLAYESNESGRYEIYVQPLPGPGPRLTVSVGGGDEPVWSPDGTTLYYRGPSRLMSATITERPKLGVTKRDSLFVDVYERNSTHTNYDVLPNGREFLMLRSVSSRPNQVSIVMNWLQLTRHARVGGAER